MNYLTNKNFCMSLLDCGEIYIRLSELNEMIDYGVFSVDQNKLQKYCFDKQVVYNKGKTSKEDFTGL